MKLFFACFLCIYSLSSFSQSTESSISPFLNNIVAQFPNVRDIALTSSKDEAVFSAQSAMGDLSVLISVSKIKGEWVSPKVISFSGRYFDLEPFFSKDGLSLYFVSNRPLDQVSSDTKDFDIWFVKRITLKDEWSQPINIGAPINTEMDEFYPVITNSNNLYFTLDNPELNKKDDIYVSEFFNGKYTTPKRLSDSINSDGYEFNAFVSQDETFIIFTCYNREGGFGSGDLFISYKSESGEWYPSKNMGTEINSDKMDYCPFVDETNQTLYFTSKRNTLKPTFESRVNINELLDIFNTYENGLSRLYQVNFDDSINKREE